MYLKSSKWKILLKGKNKETWRFTDGILVLNIKFSRQTISKPHDFKLQSSHIIPPFCFRECYVAGGLERIIEKVGCLTNHAVTYDNNHKQLFTRYPSGNCCTLNVYHKTVSKYFKSIQSTIHDVLCNYNNMDVWILKSDLQKHTGSDIYYI